MEPADAANRSVGAPCPPTASIARRPKREPTHFLQLILSNAQIDRLATQLLALDSHVQHLFVSSSAYLGIRSVGFLLRESRQLPLDICPCFMPLDNAFDGIADLVLVRSYLFGAIPVSEGVGVVLDGLEVNGDTQGCTELIVPRIPLAYRRRRVINSVRDP